MTTESTPGTGSLAGLIRYHADRRGDRTALAWESGEMTFRELDDQSSRVARALAEYGVSPGDRVAYLDKNAPEFFEVFYGCAKFGAVMTPLNWRLAEPEFAAIIEDAGAAILIAGAEFAAAAERVQAAVGCLQRVLVVGRNDPDAGFEAWRDASEPLDPGHEGSPSDMVLQLYTSGTTGLPKGVMLSEANLVALARLRAGRCSACPRTTSTWYRCRCSTSGAADTPPSASSSARRRSWCGRPTSTRCSEWSRTGG